MAFQTLHAPATPPRAIAAITGFFAALAQAVAMASGAQARYDEIRALQALSDEELADRNIERSDIVHHVYADLMAD